MRSVGLALAVYRISGFAKSGSSIMPRLYPYNQWLYKVGRFSGLGPASVLKTRGRVVVRGGFISGGKSNLALWSFVSN
jgi:hypothetical protein